QRLDPARPGLTAPEQAQHGQVRAAGQAGDRVRRDAGGVGHPVVSAGGAGGEGVGVGGGEQQDRRHSPDPRRPGMHRRAGGLVLVIPVLVATVLVTTVLVTTVLVTTVLVIAVRRAAG